MIRTANDIVNYLSLASVGFSDAGQYSCRAQLSGGGTEGPVDAGYLTVVGKQLLITSITSFFGDLGNCQV